jgi:uncharacterized protein (TIGR02145 family)
MKKRLLFLGFLLIVFGLRIDAQTLKNIHRHNLPVLRIPTHLIDKVETSEVNGERVLNVIQLNGYVSQIPVSQIDSITHSLGEAVDPAQLGNLRTASVMGVVSGPTGAPEMNAIVRSPYGGEETRTDPNGVFFLNNILVYDKLGYITITKPGFHQGSRSFLPLENGSNRVNVQLLSMTQSGTFFSAAGGTVTSGLLQLSFPANAIQLNGQPYTGTVKVFAAALDPTSTAMFDQMPGELLGGMNDSLRLLRSFGMASIELRDANMNELQLADSVSATLTFSIPSALQADAPQTIDWWSFDELNGYWRHEGEATKQGTQYVVQASHFSWWNLDIPVTYNDFTGVVYSNTASVANAKIELISPSLGSGYNYTNSSGEFSGRVPQNETLLLNISLICQTTNDWALVFTESIISEDSSISGTYFNDFLGYYPITGLIVNCDSQSVESAYIKIGSQIFLTQNGIFELLTCQTGDYLLQAFNTSISDSITFSAVQNVIVDEDGLNVGVIITCTPAFGTVIDINGNIYITVNIGNQLWMAENLRSANFANGELITNVSDDSEWINLSNSAWCSYDNIGSNDGLYGKLYNFYATVDPRGLCPAGWHVPFDEEWTELTDYLGGLGAAGGKMKSLTGWFSPNTGATNESGFSAFPGGYRGVSIGEFISTCCYAFYWSSSEVDIDPIYGYWRVLNYDNDNVTNGYNDKESGVYVRCIKN